MPAKPRKPKSETAPEERLSMRLSVHGVAAAKEHAARMEKLTGAAVSRSQAIESLIAAGALVWSAVERTGSWSPTALIDAGERVQADAMNALKEASTTSEPDDDEI
jgi:hypothetical protein